MLHSHRFLSLGQQKSKYYYCATSGGRGTHTLRNDLTRETTKHLRIIRKGDDLDGEEVEGHELRLLPALAGVRRHRAVHCNKRPLRNLAIVIGISTRALSEYFLRLQARGGGRRLTKEEVLRRVEDRYW